MPDDKTDSNSRALPHLGLSEDEWTLWRRDPATMAFFGFLADWAASVREQWRRGEEWTPESRMAVGVLDSLVNLTAADLDAWYREQGEADGRRAG